MPSVEPSLLGARRLRELMAEHGIRPSKALGQNFVIDPNTIRKVVQVAELEGSEGVLEIGPGAGSLTLALAGTSRRVTAIELDRKLLPVLEEALKGVDNVDVIHGDAMEADLGAIDASKLVANLPYNVAVPVVMRVLTDAPAISSLTVMTQREVGERLAAGPGTKAYGQVSVAIAYYASARVAASVSRNAFWPVPNVDSVLVRIDRRDPPSGDRELLFGILRAGFGQRRKMLRGALEGVVADPVAALERAGLPPEARAEELGLEQFLALAEAAEDLGRAP